MQAFTITTRNIQRRMIEGNLELQEAGQRSGTKLGAKPGVSEEK
jgi:hypothetical protein